jgi:MGT family glycosyltransferase
MELPHRPDDRIVYVGPMLEPDRVERPLADADARRLQALQQERAGQQGGRTDEPGRPLVYCSLGTVWSANQRFLRLVLQVFDKRRDWNLVLSLGGADRQALDLGPIPPNALVLDWAPQMRILADADCFVTHGGVKSLSEAVHFEVPVVTYSTGFVDQDGNARRVAHHGLGVMGQADNVSAAGIEADVERTLGNPDMGAALAAMNAHLRSYEAAPVGTGPGALVEVVRQTLEQHKR